MYQNQIQMTANSPSIRVDVKQPCLPLSRILGMQQFTNVLDTSGNIVITTSRFLTVFFLHNYFIIDILNINYLSQNLSNIQMTFKLTGNFLYQGCHGENFSFAQYISIDEDKIVDRLDIALYDKFGYNIPSCNCDISMTFFLNIIKKIWHRRRRKSSTTRISRIQYLVMRAVSFMQMFFNYFSVEEIRRR